MRISSASPNGPVRPAHISPAAAQRPSAPPANTNPATDSVVLDRSSDSRKVWGSIGAMTGALSGRVLVSTAGAVAGAVGANLLGFGTIGSVVGAGLGLYGGVKFELATRSGRLLGGMVGGTLGTVAGAALDQLGVDASDTLAHECRGFTLGSLPGKLLNTHYTSHPKMSGPLVEEGMALAQPGDIIITNDDGDFMIELLQKLGGASANWTHNYMVDSDGTVMDILLTENKPTRWDLRVAFEDNCHAKILRPKYASEQSKEKTLQYARDQFDKIEYDFRFDLESDDAQYCQEYAYKALKAGAPEITIEPGKAFFFRDIISADEFSESPDMEEVWSSGSNFWLNWLSHFN